MNTVIRASAGSGKTHRLANRFLALAFAGEPVDAVLATTFTRKAAGEILARVLRRLAEAVDDPQKLADLANQLGDPRIDRPRCLKMLIDLVQRLHRLRVGTLDSFFIQVARCFALELGLTAGWQIIDEGDDAALRNQAIRDLLRTEETGDALRLMHLLTKGEVSRSVAGQMQDLVAELYGVYLEAPAGAWRAIVRRRELDAAAFDRAVSRLASLECDGKSFVTARDESVALLRQEGWKDFLGKGIPKCILAGQPTYCRKEITAAVDGAYRPLVEHAVAKSLNQVVDQTAATCDLLERFDKHYRRLKESARAMRFEDVTRRLDDAAVAERLDEIAFRLDGGIRHVLLDEFQDTSPQQYRAVRPFAKKSLQSPRGSFFCVGDVKQAIYGWRGGSAEIFDTIEREFDVQIERLDVSRRSSPAVIETVNRVFEDLKKSGNPVREKFPAAAAAWSKRFCPHETVRKNLPGYCRMVVGPDASETQTAEEALHHFTAREIARLRQEAPWASVGVLLRTNDAVSKLMGCLSREGIEASEEGGVPLTSSPAVKKILELLKLVDHPQSMPARFCTAHSPLGPLVGLARYDDDTQACQASLEIRRRLLNEGYGRVITDWVRAFAPHCDERDLGRLTALVEMAYGYEDQASLRTDDFVRMVEQRKVEDPRSAAVRVMTIHQSKGLEFGIVVLPELDARFCGQTPRVVVGRPGPADPPDRVLRYVSQDLQPLLPADFQQMFADHQRLVVEESLCLLYVALTRAIHALHLVVPPSTESERTLPTSMAGMLRTALTGSAARLDAGKVAYEHGDPLWHRSGPAVEPAPRPEGATLDIRLKLEKPSRGLERVTPSSLEGQGKVEIGHILSKAAAQALDRGDQLHKLFEKIEWLETADLGDAALHRAADRFHLAESERDALLADFRRCLAHAEIAAALRQESYASGNGNAAVLRIKGLVQPRWVARTEVPFAIEHQEKALRGQIDRLVVLYDGDRPMAAEILDYKTDRVHDRGAVAKRVEEYRPQIEAYRVAVQRLYGLAADRVSARLLFVEPGIAESV